MYAGLLDHGQVEELMDARIRCMEEAYIGNLDERERIKAADFLTKARRAAEEQWDHAVGGAGSAARRAKC